MAVELPTETEVPAKAVAALSEALGERLVAVVLFGSRARGDAKPESDWDLLVIAEGLPERTLDRHLFLKRSLRPGSRGPVSMLARTPAEFEGHLPSIYLDVAIDGEILYDPVGYARDRLSRVRRIIARCGLYREHTPAGDLWTWKREPTRRWVLHWNL
jgi:predicted nucleotidyltransferase